MIKALFFDVDGTLITLGKGNIADSAIEGINKAREKGIKIIVATGRGYKYLHQEIKDRVKADYYVMCNGGCINESDGRCILSHSMTLKQTEGIIDYCLANDYPFGFKFDDSLQVYHRWNDFTDKYCNKAVLIQNIDNNEATKDYHLTHGLPLDVFIYSPQQKAIELVDKVDGLFGFNVGKFGSEFYNSEVNKGKTIGELCQMLNIKKEECMAFGDGDNDLAMFDACGISVAMKVSSEKVLKRADYITTDIDDNGIYNALKHFEII